MQKLMQGRDIDPTQMGMVNQIATNDQGQAIRNSNLASSNPEGLAGLSDMEAGDHQGKSNCILISNMFDPTQVNLDKDPSFFIDIKT